MDYLKTFLILGICFLLGIGLAHGFKHYRGSKGALATARTGVGNAPQLHGFALTLGEATPAALASLPVSQLHATAVTISYPASGAAGKALVEAVAAAHTRGAQVLLLPPAVFASSNPYPVALEKVAQEAQAAKVDALCLTWLNTEMDAAALTRETAAVRGIFSGKLILAATPEVLVAIESFEDVDYVGAIGPVRLPQRLPRAREDDVDLKTMRVFWECVLGSLESRAVKGSRPLLLLNMSVPQTIQARMPVAGEMASATPNPELQALAYEALLIQTKGRPSIEGLFLPWSMGSNPADTVGVNRSPELVRKLDDLWSSAAPMPPATSEPAPDPEPSFDGMLPLEN